MVALTQDVHHELGSMPTWDVVILNEPAEGENSVDETVQFSQSSFRVRLGQTSKSITLYDVYALAFLNYEFENSTTPEDFKYRTTGEQVLQGEFESPTQSLDLSEDRITFAEARRLGREIYNDLMRRKERAREAEARYWDFLYENDEVDS